MGSDFERTNGDRPDSHPHQLQDSASHSLDHAPHLTVSAFGQRDLQKRLGIRIANSGHRRRPGWPILENDALPQLRQRRIVQFRGAFDEIRLLDVILGIRQAFGKLRIVRQNQQPARIHVQPPDRRQKLAHAVQQIVDRLAALRIPIRGHITLRLVEQHIPGARPAQRASIDFDPVPRQVDPLIGILDHLAIDRYPPRMNPAARLGTRPKAGF